MNQLFMTTIRRHFFLLGSMTLVALVVLPMVVHKEAAFLGADEQAGALITAMNPDYEPWIGPVWEPPSGEVASLLFALQAALGAGLLGYGLAYLKYQQSPR